jgi:hypothetical protein
MPFFQNIIKVFCKKLDKGYLQTVYLRLNSNNHEIIRIQVQLA